MAPIVGTLGSTYKRLSTPVPEHVHPRMGLLVVRGLHCDANVAIRGMKGFRGVDTAWHFESKRPLVPGIPHVYHVVATYLVDNTLETEVRTVRLIPGRIVYLDYH